MYSAGMHSLYRVMDWIGRLIYINILWIFFTLIGLIVFGFFPATAGLFTVVRQWLLKKTDISIWQTFWTAYRESFVKANIIGFIFVIIGWILQIDLRFFQAQSDTNLTYLCLTYFSIGMFIIYMVVALFLFPTFVHYELKTVQYIKQAFFIVILRPMDASMAVAGFIIVYYVMTTMPVFIIFFGISSLAITTMWAANRAFTHLQ